MTITATDTGLLISGPEDGVATVTLTGDDGEDVTLDMSLVTSDGMDAIAADTDHELVLKGFWRGADAFVDPDLTPLSQIKNVIYIDPNSKSKSTGVLYQNRDGLIKFSHTEALTTSVEIIFGLYSLAGTSPLFSTDLNRAVSIDDSYINIVLTPDDLTMSGQYYFEIIISNDAKSQKHVGYLNVVETRL